MHAPILFLIFYLNPKLSFIFLSGLDRRLRFCCCVSAGAVSFSVPHMKKSGPTQNQTQPKLECHHQEKSTSEAQRHLPVRVKYLAECIRQPVQPCCRPPQVFINIADIKGSFSRFVIRKRTEITTMATAWAHEV